jgi:CMP-2-keto-3-deoxyoctulosonic acid synthetase
MPDPSPENRVIIVPMLRRESTRLPDKVLRPLGGNPLAAWTLEKVRDVAEQESVDCRVGIAEGEAPLIELVYDLDMIPLYRNRESVTGETVEEIYNKAFTSQLAQWDVIILVCACSPFVDPEVYRKAIRLAKDATHQGLAAFLHRGWVWNDDGELIVGDPFLNTKTSPVYFTPAHIFDILKVERVGTPRMLEGCLPVVVEDSLPNRIHVDTEEDWRLAELYLQSQQLREGG